MRPLLWDKLAESRDRRNVEVEQDRAPPVLPYHAGLERPPADGSHCGRLTHRCDDDWTKARLKVECALDERTWGKGIRVADAEMDAFDLTGDTSHPEWNYTIKPCRFAESQQLLLWVS